MLNWCINLIYRYENINVSFSFYITRIFNMKGWNKENIGKNRGFRNILRPLCNGRTQDFGKATVTYFFSS